MCVNAESWNAETENVEILEKNIALKLKCTAEHPESWNVKLAELKAELHYLKKLRACLLKKPEAKL